VYTRNSHLQKINCEPDGSIQRVIPVSYWHRNVHSALSSSSTSRLASHLLISQCVCSLVLMLCPDRLEQSALIVHTADYFRSQLKTYVLKTFVAGLLSGLSRVINSLLTYLLTLPSADSVRLRLQVYLPSWLNPVNVADPTECSAPSIEQPPIPVCRAHFHIELNREPGHITTASYSAPKQIENFSRFF